MPAGSELVIACEAKVIFRRGPSAPRAPRTAGARTACGRSRPNDAASSQHSRDHPPPVQVLQCLGDARELVGVRAQRPHGHDHDAEGEHVPQDRPDPAEHRTLGTESTSAVCFAHHGSHTPEGTRRVRRTRDVRERRRPSVLIMTPRRRRSPNSWCAAWRTKGSATYSGSPVKRTSISSRPCRDRRSAMCWFVMSRVHRSWPRPTGGSPAEPASARRPSARARSTCCSVPPTPPPTRRR